MRKGTLAKVTDKLDVTFGSVVKTTGSKVGKDLIEVEIVESVNPKVSPVGSYDLYRAGSLTEVIQSSQD